MTKNSREPRLERSRDREDKEKNRLNKKEKVPALDIFRMAGIKNAKVFPEPVIAIPITSLPDSKGGQH